MLRVKNMHPWSPSDRCRQGKAEVRIHDFKTPWSEFQKANQTATEQGNAERISNQMFVLRPKVGPKQLCA